MAEIFITTLSPIIVMFGFMIIGFILKKFKVLPDNAGTVISKLISNLLIPALIISTFSKNCNLASIKSEGVLFLLGTIMIAISVAVAIPLSNLFEKKDKYTRNIYRYALAVANFGFMGYAVVPAIMGHLDSEILYKFILFTLPINIVSCVWGANILTPKKDEKGVLKNLLTPIFISCIIGAIIGMTGTRQYIPKEVLNIIEQLEVCMSPLAMIVTGFVIGSFEFKKLFSNAKIYFLTFLRLILFPVIMIYIAKLLGGNEITLAMTLFAFGTPVGLNCVVFPAANGGDVMAGASMTMVSTLGCLITIPLMYSAIMFLL